LTYEANLANHLRQSGAYMYGAYWCPHCAAQKDLFGVAANQIPYIECDPQGENSQAALCQAKGIQGYPTWEINGERYVGVQPLGKLAELSGFEPPAGEPSR
jgi:glutaredoxin